MPNENLKMFVWDSLLALKDEYNGCAVVLAHDLEEAIILVVNSKPLDGYHNTYPRLKEDVEWELRSSTPTIQDEPSAFVTWG